MEILHLQRGYAILHTDAEDSGYSEHVDKVGYDCAECEEAYFCFPRNIHPLKKQQRYCREYEEAFDAGAGPSYRKLC